MIARVSLEIALRKEFDYSIPAELAGQIDVGSRVQVPFGPRKILGVVTAVAEESGHANLKPILKVIGAQTLVTPKVLKLARWIGEYYCCAPEIALKSVLPEAVRKEDAGWRERLFVRALAVSGEFPKLPKRQQDVWNIIEERRELPLTELLELTKTTASTVRKLEDRGLVSITSEVSERDPYARETILPTQNIVLNPAQAQALGEITKAMDTENSSRTFLLHGVTGSGKTEIYLQALAHALEQGKGAIVLVPEISLTPQTVERFKARFSSGKLQTLVAVLHSHLSAGERHDEWHKIRQAVIVAFEIDPCWRQYFCFMSLKGRAFQQTSDILAHSFGAGGKCRQTRASALIAVFRCPALASAVMTFNHTRAFIENHGRFAFFTILDVSAIFTAYEGIPLSADKK